MDKLYWPGRALRMVRIREAVPLGYADRVCRRLEEIWGRHDGAQRANWTEEFKHAVRAVQAEIGQGEPGNAELEEVILTGAEGLAANVRLREAARTAGVRLAGRSLLQDEAAQLLDGAAAPSEQGMGALAALQLAALNGALQLTAAVAPKPPAPPRRGLRFLAERLRPARLLGRAAMPRRPQELLCRRCGSGRDKLRRTNCAACGQACAYCEACLTMGRSRECGLLIIGAPAVPTAGYASHRREASSPSSLVERWGLSPAQGDASAQALAFLSGPAPDRDSLHESSFLLWAVTGAGKTEMIFPLLEHVLARGGRALVATPRRDVVLELAPRLAKAFPDYERAVLYGGSTDRWGDGALTIATTHQLLRFQEAFDLVLIDELDAFPYHNDPMLHYAADKCRKRNGFTVLLSATPPAHLQRAVSRKRLACARVPARFHGYPLPVPRSLVIPPVYRILGGKTLPEKLVKVLRHSVRRGAQIFLFVPYVKQVDPFVHLLRNCASQLGLEPDAIAGTSSQDAERSGKVVSFREQTIKLLVTTTILERGVTIPKSDVFILDANNPLFDSASLVQMAGRAGRSAADPFGLVFYAAPVWTESQRRAIKQIRNMNSLAKRKGFLRTTIR
ncbi:DNA/RNA helicase [Cohnella terricola]|uniref:DNA/RNA helicase n=2 Tax=Cohnella terricola TaxID=1289167 RepID=A0A559J8B5_9BACL|nr:DNA/RNA helicase [Cohnella terricola]